MTYGASIAKRFGKRFIWLYKFTFEGNDTFLASTPFSTPYVDGNGQAWQPSPVTHSRFRVTSALQREDVDFVFPQSDAMARLYLGDLSYEPNFVTAYHHFKGASPTEEEIKFTGSIIGAEPRLTRILLKGRNRITEVGAKGLANVMQTTCPHILYHQTRDGYGCTANLADFLTPASCSAYASRVATVAAAAGQPDGTYAGGVLVWNGKRQLIREHFGSSLTLLNDLVGFEAAVGGGAQSIEIARGCDRTRGTCANVFNKLLDNGAFPGMDVESQFDGKTVY